MKNENMRVIDLTLEEMVYMGSFIRTLHNYNLNTSIYHFGTYKEGTICITNKNNIWEFYTIKNGVISDKNTFESFLDLCLQLIKNRIESKEQCMQIICKFKEEVEENLNILKQAQQKALDSQNINPALEIKK